MLNYGISMLASSSILRKPLILVLTLDAFGRFFRCRFEISFSNF
jgi:hypothetical protein